MDKLSPDLHAEVLNIAADIIEQRGWCQNNMMDPEGRVCLLGALNMSSSGARIQVWDHVSPVIDDLAKYLGVSIIVTWNDEVGRTQFEVVNVLRKRAAEVSAKVEA